MKLQVRGVILLVSVGIFVIASYFLPLGREKAQLNEVTVDALLTAAKGDMRKAVTLLQSCHQLTQGKREITPEMVIDVTGEVSTWGFIGYSWS